MQKITSFTVDHTKLDCGIYISRVDGDITTYDLRHKKPNVDAVLDNETMHTLEHMLATFLRNSEIAEKVIYFGPMGCQTGFYLLIRNAESEETKRVLIKALQDTINHNGEVFGNSAVECGNHKTLNLEKAKKEAESYLKILENTTTFNY